jgi:hypothetical protein
MPAFALFKHTLQADGQENATFDEAFFHNAVKFVIKNGRFRHFIPVPADVAHDGQERVNRFLCPAVNTIHDQLMDGMLLSHINRAVQQRAAAGDEAVNGLLSHIRLNNIRGYHLYQASLLPKNQVYVADKALPEALMTGILVALRKKMDMTFEKDGQHYTFQTDELQAKFDKAEWAGKKRWYDKRIQPRAGSDAEGALLRAMTIALTGRRAVYFTFYDDSYRVTRAKVRQILPLYHQEMLPKE